MTHPPRDEQKTRFMLGRMRIGTAVVPPRSKSVENTEAAGSPVDKSGSALETLRYRCVIVTERQDDIPGMGSVPRGPSFVPWTSAEPAPRQPPPPITNGASLGPPRSRRPAVISILAIVLVAAVVATASLVAYWGDTHVAAPPRPEVRPSLTSPTDRIDFVSDEGTGQLILRTRSWVNDGAEPPESGSYLRVEVELVCTSGEVDYDPYHFQAFDRSGQLFEMEKSGAAGRELGVGTLRAGERIRGTVAFDMPRGDVTLLMSDDSEKTVTALKVPD
jgi:hypothetical protein